MSVHAAQASDPDWLVETRAALRTLHDSPAGLLLLFKPATPWLLQRLVLALLPDLPALHVLSSAPLLSQLPVSATAILWPRSTDALWLNQHRPILTTRALRVLLCCDANLFSALQMQAPDLLSWASAAYTVHAPPMTHVTLGLQEARRLRLAAVRWDDEASAAQLAIGSSPTLSLPRLSPRELEESLVQTSDFVLCRGADSPSQLLRLRLVLAAQRDAPTALVPTALPCPGWLSLHAKHQPLPAAEVALARAPAPGRLAAILALEPEAVALAARLMAPAPVGAGMDGAELEAHARAAMDPGAALAQLALRHGLLTLADAAWADAELAPPHPPVFRALASDPAVALLRQERCRNIAARITAREVPTLNEAGFLGAFATTAPVLDKLVDTPRVLVYAAEPLLRAGTHDKGAASLLRGALRSLDDPALAQLLLGDEGEVPRSPAALPSSLANAAGLGQQRKQRQEMAKILRELSLRLRAMEFNDRAQEIEAYARRAEEAVLRLAVIGEFSSGKSTLLNALLGFDLLPHKAVPCTRVPTTVQAGDKLTIEAIGADGRVERFEPATLEEAHHRLAEMIELPPLLGVSETTQVSMAMLGSSLREVRLLCPLAFLPASTLLQDGVALVDTPGLNETRSRSQMTLGLLPFVDAVILTSKANGLLTLEERSFLEQEADARSAWLERLFIVVTYADLFRGRKGDGSKALQQLEQRLAGFCRGLPGTELSPGRRFFLDAASAREQPAEIAALLWALRRFLAEERGGLLVEQLVRQARTSLAQACAAIEGEVARLDADGQDAAQRQAEARQRIAAVRADGDIIHTRLSVVGARYVTTLEQRLRQEVASWQRQLEESLPPFPKNPQFRQREALEWYKAETWDKLEKQLQAFQQREATSFATALLEQAQEDPALSRAMRAVATDLVVLGMTLRLPQPAPEGRTVVEMLYRLLQVGLVLGGGAAGMLLPVMFNFDQRGMLINMGVMVGTGALGALLLGGPPGAALGFLASLVLGIGQVLTGKQRAQAKLHEQVLKALAQSMPRFVDEAAKQLTDWARGQVVVIDQKIQAALQHTLAEMEAIVNRHEAAQGESALQRAQRSAALSSLLAAVQNGQAQLDHLREPPEPMLSPRGAAKFSFPPR